MISAATVPPRPPARLFREPGSQGAPAGARFVCDVGGVLSASQCSKPQYADYWLIGDPGRLEVIDEYDIRGTHVVIGTTPEGQTEYNILPMEFAATDLANGMITDAISAVREAFRNGGGRSENRTVGDAVAAVIQDRAPEIADPQNPEGRRLRDIIEGIVGRYSTGIGVFEILLGDPRIEDVYVDAPCDQGPVHVTLGAGPGANSRMGCDTNIYLEKRELASLINVLKRTSGLPYCSSNPVLETDVPAFNARATVVGYPMSPNGDAVAIRRHSDVPWTLTRLIHNGTMTAEQAGLLSFLVNNRTTFLICGARGAGKSSLLSALMFEFPVSQRILTIEDTAELPCMQMRRMGYKVQSIMVDEHMDGSSESRGAEALRVSLRMGESQIVIGEVRGGEAKVLYESMRTGRAGSSVMGTIHGDSARTVYDRVIHDMGIAPEAFAATDILITMGSRRDRGTGADRRGITEIVATIGVDGSFADIDPGNPSMSLRPLKRAAEGQSLSPKEALDEIRARQIIHGRLAEKGAEDAGYLGPEWTAAANALAVSMSGRTDAEIVQAVDGLQRPQRGRVR